MKKVYLLVIALLVSISLMGCNSNAQDGIKDYNDNDVAAIVKDKEITIGDLRFLYPDDKVLENIKGTVKAELVMQEAKKMNLDVSDEQNQIKEESTYSSKEKPTRDFVESQAEKFGMEPEKYYRKYTKITTELAAYMNAYTKEKLGEPSGENEEKMKKYNKDANHLLNELVKKNEDDIKILIN